MKQTGKQRLRRQDARYVLALAACLLVLGACLLLQTRSTENQQKTNSTQVLSQITDTLESNAKTRELLTDRYHQMNQSMLQVLGELFNYDAYAALDGLDSAERCAALAEIWKNTGAGDIFIIDRTGTIQLATSTEYLNGNLVRDGAMTAEELAELTRNDADRQGTRELTAGAEGTADYRYHPVQKYLADNDITVYFYSLPFQMPDGSDSGMYLVALDDAALLERELENIGDLKKVLDNVNAGTENFAFAVDTATETLFCYSNGVQDFSGSPCEEIGLSAAALRDGYTGRQTLLGVRYYCVAMAPVTGDDGEDLALIEAVPEASLNEYSRWSVLCSVVAFGVAAGLVMAYALIRRNDAAANGRADKKIALPALFGAKKKYRCNITVGLKTLPMLVGFVVLLWGVSMYAQTLLALSRAAISSTERLTEVKNLLATNTETAQAVTDYYDDQYSSRAKLLAYLLEVHPELAFAMDKSDENTHPTVVSAANGDRTPILDMYGNPEYSTAYSTALQGLCDAGCIDDVFVYDDLGNVLATNTRGWYFSLATDPEAQSYAMRSVLEGRNAVYVQPAQKNEDGNMFQYVGCIFHYYTCQEEDGSTRYVSRVDYNSQRAGTWEGPLITRHDTLLQIGAKPERIADVMETTTLPYLLESLNGKSGEATVAFDDDEEHTVLYSPNKESIGKTAAEIGVGESVFSGSYNGFQRINGVEYFQSCGKMGDIYVSTATPTASLYRLRNGIALGTALLSGLLLLVLLGIVIITDEGYDAELTEALADRARGREEPQMITLRMPSGKEKRVLSAASRWDGVSVSWQRMSPEQKFGRILKINLTGVTVLMFAALLGIRSAGNSDSIFTYISSRQWDRSLNIFAFTACAMLMIMLLVGTNLIKLLISVLTAGMGARAETVGHLINSVLKYGSVLAGLFFCLYLLGFDAGALLTSAGILTMVIGLGAQSLISDILAGMFIVFEGEFRVGDIVTVGDFRGQVLDIGLRTTKIEGLGKNIKIFNNSAISGVLNMTKEVSYANCEFSIGYQEPLERVESILKAAFPEIRKKQPAILAGPFYHGVFEMGERAVKIRILAQCQETERSALTRALNREVLLLLERNHISTAIAMPGVGGQKAAAPATPAEERAADRFVAEQKNATRTVHTEEEEKSAPASL